MIRTATLVTLGYDPALGERLAMTTASGIEYVPRVRLNRLHAIGVEHEALSVVAHTLPASSIVQGLLGLDFFRGRRLEVDFRRGTVNVE